MFLFKKPILKNYNLMHYTADGFLLLHCSKNDVVYAPFDGKVEFIDGGCILYNNEFKLYISHIACEKEQEVSAGDIIGTPKFEKDKAYIGLKIVKDNELQNIATYLDHLDKSLVSKKEIKVEEKVEVEEISKEITVTKPKTRKKSKKNK